MDITGRKLFVKALQEEGVDTIFGYPGGMVTDLFDELYKQDGIEVVLPRHEQGLLHEAEGYAKATGKVGVCLVTSGPGATNIITGLADAHYDNIPLVCFTGQVPLNLIGNDAFQEVDIVGMTRSDRKYHRGHNPACGIYADWVDIYIENNGVYLTSCGSRRKYGYYRKKIICKSITGRGRRYHFRLSGRNGYRPL